MNFRSYIFFIASCTLLFSCNRKEAKNYIQYIDILHGTAPATTISAKNHNGDHVGHGQTVPAVTAPFGMTQWTPQIYDNENKCIAPYYQGSTMLQGFRASHWLSGSCTQDYGSFTVFPTRIAKHEEFKFSPRTRQTMFLMKTENATPAYSSFLFPEKNIMTEITATKRCGFFRFSWLNEKQPTVIIDINSDEQQGYIKIDLERNEIYGYNPVHRIYQGHGKSAGFSGYFVARFDHDFTAYGTLGSFTIDEGNTEAQNDEKVGAYISFKLENNEPVKMKVGTSFTSIENARKNLNAEIPDWDFEATKLSLETNWNQLMGTIDVQSQDINELRKFYTALYHASQHPRLYSDVNGDYPAFSNDYKIKNTTEFEFYGDFSNWDIYRAQMPLLSLIAPKQYHDMVKSLISMAEDGGWLPIFPMWNSYTSAMIGDHSTAIIADAAMKGFDFDLEKAYHYMRKNAYETPSHNEYMDGKGRRALNSYLEFGYVPLEEEVAEAFHKNEQVSRTLEYAYNDWCVAQVAKKLDKQNDFADLSARASNYLNVWDEEQGWMNGCYGDGTFYEDFEANQEHFFITEGTSKHYSWYVPHDMNELISLMGGKEAFGERLNDLIARNEYWHGNEPSHQIPYLFNYSDQWALTQKTVKHILRTEYDLGPGGISGNDDAGQMSAWYIYSAMGFYPVCPGSNEYQLSSPVFENVTLNLDKNYYPGGKFVLKTPLAGPSEIFNKVKLNGEEISTTITHEDIQKGGKLEFLK